MSNDPQIEFVEHIKELFPEIINEKGFSIEVGPGWFHIVEEFIGEIYSQYRASANKAEWLSEFEISSIKEKFGRLRVQFWATQDTEQIRAGYKILNKSIVTCEKCGRPGVLRSDLLWHKTLCDEHYEFAKVDFLRM